MIDRLRSDDKKPRRTVVSRPQHTDDVRAGQSVFLLFENQLEDINRATIASAMVSSAFFVFLLQVASSLAAPPTVQLDRATVTGVTDGTLKKFLGIPYVLPPVGPLRLRLPSPIPSYEENFAAMDYGPICLQMEEKLVLPADVPEIVVEEVGGVGAPIPLNQSEDCLTMNVIAPANATPNSKLPVLVWIYGGGFEIGYPSSTDGSVLVNQSISLGTPIVYVSLNYRLNVMGFLASKEVKEAGLGNLGLQDQREALRWVQRYITQFGGDPTKVTLWGESAGAISTAAHLVTNGGNNEGLFRAAIMDSGSPLWVGDITHGQPSYDFIVEQTGCSHALDTLDCLRDAPVDTLMRATNSTPNMFSYQSLAETFIIRVDGVFLKDNPQQLVKQGSVSNVPFINGVNDDEGTLFSFTALNLSEEIADVFALYPSDPAAGSPFNTSDANALTPMFKRYAAIMGDFVFQGPHRFFMQHRSDLQPTWSYLYKRGKDTPYLGTYHGSELLNAYGGGDLGEYFIRFVATLNPSPASNASTQIVWPRYTTKSPDMLTFLDGDVPLTITQDDYRVEAIQAGTELLLKYPY
ncbi:Carboxylic ester hydrolase [Mycena sanguinolenta]|uniref:Carboxylic ester hydrolase n=1 Tax=Mycena sanguinolenta TaxID=230812 RepID=A0A8H7DCV0_9AGAR|nr:Carboxylic ester hydrolase [Mycena sanguinolenta]